MVYDCQSCFTTFDAYKLLFYLLVISSFVLHSPADQKSKRMLSLDWLWWRVKNTKKWKIYSHFYHIIWLYNMLFYVARTFHLDIHIILPYPHPSTALTYYRFALRRWQPEAAGYSYCLCYHAVHDIQHLYLPKRSNLYIPN